MKANAVILTSTLLLVVVAIIVATSDVTGARMDQSDVEQCRNGNVSRAWFRRQEVMDVGRLDTELETARTIFPILWCAPTVANDYDPPVRIARSEELRFIRLVVCEHRRPIIENGRVARTVAFAGNGGRPPRRVPCRP